jgi:hypothetical protein
MGRVVPATALMGEWQAKLSSEPTAAFLFGPLLQQNLPLGDMAGYRPQLIYRRAGIVN